MARATRTNWTELRDHYGRDDPRRHGSVRRRLAAGWAIAGLFELGSTFEYILMGLFSLIGAYILLALWRKAVAIEPISE